MLTLPAEVTLTCGACETAFSLSVRALSRRIEVTCPLCSQKFFWFDGLPAMLKREVQQEVKEAVRNLITKIEDEVEEEQSGADEEVLRLILRRIVAEHNQ